MKETAQPAQVICFATFVVDLRAGEVRKGGSKLKLSGQPFQVLAILLEQPGQIVTREELQKRLWPDTFVDVDHSLNTAINKIREVLGDSAENPRFVETLPRRGYRFIGSLNGSAAGGAPDPVTSSNRPQGNRKSASLLVIVGFAVIALIGVGSFLYTRMPAAPATPKQRGLYRLTFDRGLQVDPTWSPDGRYIAYTADRTGKFDIWVQQVSGGDAVQITKGPDHHWQPVWSPNGKYIAYRSEEGEGGLYVIPPLGGDGQERRIASFGYRPHWSPDGSQLLFQTHFGGIDAANRFYVVGLDGGPPREVLGNSIAAHKIHAGAAVWHPDGQRISLWAWGEKPSPTVWTIALDGGTAIRSEISPEVEKQFTEVARTGTLQEHHGEISFCWAPKGDAIYFDSGYQGAINLWKMTVEPKTLRAIRLDRLTTGPGPDGGVAISPDGQRLAFASKSERFGNWLFQFNATTGQIIGNGQSISAPGRLAIVPSLSPDGKKVVFSVSNNGKWDLWEASLEDGHEAPLIVDEYDRRYAQWSPDGKQVAYTKFKPLTIGQIMVWSRGLHNEEPITGVLRKDPLVYDWSPDGKTLLVTQELEGQRPTVWRMPLAAAPHAENAAKEIISSPSYSIWQPHYSPNGRWILFQAVSNEETAARSTLFVVAAEGGPWEKITDGKVWDDKPRWSADGKTIYFVSGRGAFFNVCGIRFDDRTGDALGKPFQISDFAKPSFAIPRWIPVVALSVTHNRLLVTMQESTGNVWVLDGVDR